MRSTRGSGTLPAVDELGLLDFIPRISPHFSAPEHLRPLADAIERACEQPVRAIVSTPPRHGKTETLLHGIVWLLLRDPTRTIAYVSYAVEFARSKSRRARWLAESIGLVLADDASRLEEWRTIEGGGLLATGIGGPLTGHGVDLLIVDDPVKNRIEAESATIRQRTWEWFTDVAYTRLEPGGSVIVVMTRWHPDDLAGRLAATGEWETIVLPALAEGNDPLGREPGAPLWPERWPLETLREIQSQIGEYSWASLYQGRPRPRGGTLFRDVTVYQEPPADGYRVSIGVDLAYTARTHADYSVAVVLAASGGVAYVLDVVRGQWEAPEFGRRLRALRERYPAASIGAFASGTERGALQFMRELGVPIRALPANTDKFVRAQPVASAWNEGRIRVPERAPWLGAFLDEVLGFTGVNDLHDDQVDALAAAWELLRGAPPAVAAVDLEDVSAVYGPERRRWQ
ncbi:MAG: phage terminase large subunit [Thermomicrobium sp.]|nr:phage terminase large subunit [Thermomicrobium sp.]MDW8005826.1 phage terminase large subunit [Thermomicrobium sp.]